MGTCNGCLGNNASEAATKNLLESKDIGPENSLDLEKNLENNPDIKVDPIQAKQMQGAVRGFLTRKQYGGPLEDAKDNRSFLKIDKMYPKLEKPLAEVQNLFVGLLESRLSPFKVEKPDDGVKTQVKPAVKLNDGAVYEGEWDKNGNLHGVGTMVKEDGSKIVGLFKGGRLDGPARVIESTGLVYEAEFKEGEMNGNGKIQNKAGGKFDGELANGKIHGKGAEEWPDGTKYEGEYREGKRHGSGVLVLPDGSTYKGMFKDGAMSGEGELKYKNGNSYVGKFKDNKMNGNGVFLWSDGRKYQGDFKNDLKHGTGTMTWPDGKSYNGMWNEGVQQGEALYTYKDKDGKSVTRKSKWENGTRVEWLDKKN